MSKPAELLLVLIENTTFSTELDSALRTCLRNRKDITSLLQNQPISGLVKDIDEALATEGGKDEYLIQDAAAKDDTPEPASGAAGGSAPELPKEVTIEIAKVSTKSEDNADKLQSWVDACWRRVDTVCVLLRETADVGAMVDRLKDTEVNKLRKEPQTEDVTTRRFILLNYDLKTAGESSSHPATRLPPLRNNGDHLKSCLRIALDALGEGESEGLGAKDLFMIFDGGRPGLAAPPWARPPPPPSPPAVAII